MSGRKWILMLLALLLMGGTAGLLAPIKANRKMGAPGVKTMPLANSKNPDLREVVLPEHMLNYTSQVVTQQEHIVAGLPKDTSFGQKLYTAPDGFTVHAQVVLMGTDRTSHHKPQFCLEGAGWRIDGGPPGKEVVRIAQPYEYDMPVIKLLVTRQFENQGQMQTWRGVFVYWFVAEDEVSADPTGFQRLWSSGRKMLTTGVMQRWAYVMFFAPCLPGQETVAFERMKALIAASVPEFQLTPKDPKRLAAGTP